MFLSMGMLLGLQPRALPFVRLFSSTSLNNARNYKHVVSRQIRQKPVLEAGDVKPKTLRIPSERPAHPEYPYGESRIFKRSNRGLYGGQYISFGNQISEMKNKSRRRWLPNVVRKRLWSEALNALIPLKLTTRVLKTVTKEGGLDNYLTKEKAARIKELGPLGWKLKYEVLKARENFEKQQIKNYELQTDAGGKPIKVYYKGLFKGDEVQVIVGRRKLLKALYPLVKYDTPGNLRYAAFNNRRKDAPFEELLKEFEKYEADLNGIFLKSPQ